MKKSSVKKNMLAHCDVCSLRPEEHTATVQEFADVTGMTYENAFVHVQRVLNSHCAEGTKLRRARPSNTRGYVKLRRNPQSLC